MKVAVSVTKVFEVDEMELSHLKFLFDRKDYEEHGIDWYDIEEAQEIWSYAIISS